LVNEVPIRLGQRPRRILAHETCADDHGAWGEMRGQTSSEPEAHQCLGSEPTDEPPGAFSSACASQGTRLHHLTPVDPDKSCRELMWQGDYQTNAAQPNTPPVTAER
jgi:hypothetical protein